MKSKKNFFNLCIEYLEKIEKGQAENFKKAGKWLLYYFLNQTWEQ